MTRLGYTASANSNADGQYIRIHVDANYAISLYALKAGNYAWASGNSSTSYSGKITLTSSNTFPYLLTNTNLDYGVVAY